MHRWEVRRQSTHHENVDRVAAAAEAGRAAGVFRAVAARLMAARAAEAPQPTVGAGTAAPF